MSQTVLMMKPQRPWKLTPKQILPDAIGALFTVATTLLLVAITPLKGN